MGSYLEFNCYGTSNGKDLHDKSGKYVRGYKILPSGGNR